VALPAKTISEIDELKLIYFEILEGFSSDVETSLFIKHFSDKESHLVLQKRVELFHYYLNEGVPHESTLLANAIENEEWSKEKEEKILQLKYIISDNERNLPNIIWEQRLMIQKVIEDHRKELAELLFERKQVLGRNIEDLVDEDVNDYVVYLSFFKDKELQHPLEKTYSDFQEWEPTKISALNKVLADQYTKFSEDNVKGVSILPMFLNKLSYSKDNIMTFLNKPVSHLSHHQSYLFSLGVRNLNILNYAKGSPPDLSLEAKVKDVVNWYDLQHALNIGRKNQQE
jgi:hypothetical protein